MPATPLLAITICGPTACGKTELALALARRVPSEIISVDSALVYRGMDIGTAKPDAQMQAAVPHHLIDLLDPAESYSAGRFVNDALKAIRAMVGWPALHRRLGCVDPAAAERIQPGDAQRIQRALEVYHLTGRPISTLQAESPDLEAVSYLNLGLIPQDRAALGARIVARFDAMLAAGLLEEVRALYERGDLSAATPSMRAVGYRQLWEYLDGHCSLEQAREAAIVATRRLAKRQLTWLRGRTDLECFEPFDPRALEWLVATLEKARH